MVPGRKTQPDWTSAALHQQHTLLFGARQLLPLSGGLPALQRLVRLRGGRPARNRSGRRSAHVGRQGQRRNAARPQHEGAGVARRHGQRGPVLAGLAGLQRRRATHGIGQRQAVADQRRRRAPGFNGSAFALCKR